MNWKKLLVFFVFVAAVSLASCSGSKNVCTTNCGGGNASLSITMFDTPPAGVDLLSFTVPITGISLTPTTGSEVSVATAVSSVEATRLQTDSALIVNAASVVAGSYTTLKVTLGPTTATSNVFINTSGSTITWTTGSGGSCANDKVCFLPAGASTMISLPISLTLASNQSQWIGLNLNLGKTFTTTGGLSVDFSQSGVLSTITTARTGLPANSVDTIEDFIGSVTAISSGSITAKSGISGQSITAILTTNTVYDGPSPYSTCGSAPANACIQVGSTVSLDATVGTGGGTITATEVDVLDAVAVDEVEGVIYPTSTANVFGLILADKVSASGNVVLAASTTTYGTGILLDVTSANAYVDTKTLTIPVGNPIGFSVSNLLAGQVVRAKVSSVTSTSSGISATATNLLLRYSRFTGTVNTVAPPNFTFNPPSYVSTFDTGLGVSPTANTYIGYTAFDGIADASGITAGSTVSIRALLLNNTNPTFAVAKVRVP